MTSSVEKKENDKDNGTYGMLEIYEQCEYILWIINNKRKRNNEGIHTRLTKWQTKIIVI